MRIADGRNAFVQWDTGQKIAFDAPVAEAHFAPRTGTVTIDVEAQLENGEYVANVPDELLQTARPVTVYAFVQDAGRYTRQIRSFEVRARPKPADYIYTPAEQKTWEQLQSQIGDLDKLKTKAKANLVAAINEAARSGGGGGESNIFAIPVEIDADTYAATSEVTLAEIRAAYDAGKVLLCVINGAGAAEILTFAGIDEETALFGGLELDSAGMAAVAFSTDGVAYRQQRDFFAVTSEITYTDEQKAQLRKNFDLAAKTDKLASPYALTFSGAVSGTYDGSTALDITIPDAADIKTYNTLDDFINRQFTDKAAIVLKAPSTAITPGAWSDVGFPAFAYTSGVSHAEAMICLTSCATAKKCSVSLQADGSYKGPYAIADLSLGVEGAKVGQTVEITEVDSAGRPTAWQPVDMPSGGGDETWELIQEIPLQADVLIYALGSLVTYKKIRMIAQQKLFTDNTGNKWLRIVNKDDQNIVPPMLNPVDTTYMYAVCDVAIDNYFAGFYKIKSNNLQTYAQLESMQKPILKAANEPMVRLELSQQAAASLTDGAKITIYGIAR